MPDEKQNPENADDRSEGDREEYKREKRPAPPYRRVREDRSGENLQYHEWDRKDIRLMREEPWPAPPEKDNEK